jgi:hypothetical protein
MLTVVLFVGLFVFAIFRKWQEPQPKEAFNRTPARLLFYAFAQCRMQCLQVSEADIKAILQTGVINLGRSRRAQRPCPTFAVQGRTARKQYIRAIFEQCRNGTYLLNCYNLERDATCDCTADYTPNQN